LSTNLDLAGLASKETAKTYYAAVTFFQILDQFGSDDDGAADRKQCLYAKWKATDILTALKEGRVPTPGPPKEEEEEEEEATTDAVNPTPPTESKTDAPDVASVSDEDADEEMLLPPPAPVGPPQAPKDEGTEMGLDGEEMDLPKPPPPAYPGHGTVNRSRPPVAFDLPPAPLPMPVPPPFVPKPAAKTSSSGGWFGNNKKDGKISKAQWADATELVRFAASAIEEKDADVAIDRLRQALATLER
jgi:vacuolar protein sorting-associated protein VTA1